MYLFESCFFPHLYNDKVGFLVTAVTFLGSRQILGVWETHRVLFTSACLKLTLHPVWRWKIELKVETKKQAIGMVRFLETKGT